MKPLFMGAYGSESSKLRFGIMFDAGSTGSRIHALRFKEIKEGIFGLYYYDYNHAWCTFKFNKIGKLPSQLLNKTSCYRNLNVLARKLF